MRELENVLERALALCENESIEADDLQLPVVNGDNDEKNPSLGEMTQNLEKEHIISALEDNRWNQSATARALGITLRQLRYRIDKQVDDADAHFARAKAEGAVVLDEPRDDGRGSRGYGAKDLEGHTWYFSDYRPGAHWA